jgi:hypothetical protein
MFETTTPNPTANKVAVRESEAFPIPENRLHTNSDICQGKTFPALLDLVKQVFRKVLTLQVIGTGKGGMWRKKPPDAESAVGG